MNASDAAHVVCPCCGGRFEAFLPFGHRQRPNAQCPKCRALERHRLLWLFLESRTPLLHRPLSVLHVAPEEALRRRLDGAPNLFYVSGDLQAPDAMVRMDLTDIPFEDASFDVVLCNHVLEHIPDDAAALREVFRVLAPGGWAVLQSPVDPDRAETYEDPSVTDPEARRREFGFHEHVRVYGRDYAARLERAGFEVEAIPFADDLDEATLRRHGLLRREPIFLCRRPPAPDARERDAASGWTVPRERHLDPRSAMNLLLARLRRLATAPEKLEALDAASARQPLIEGEVARVLGRAPEKAVVFDHTLRSLKVWLSHQRAERTESVYHVCAFPKEAERAALHRRLGAGAAEGLERLVVLVTVDCMRGDRLSANGCPRPITPALDALAAEGVNYRRAYATAGQTSQSFPGLLLSNFFQNFGRSRAVPDALTSVAEVFSRNGYRTVALNAANPHISRFYGYDKGFDEYTDFIGDRNFLHEEDAFVDNSDRRLEAPSQQELMARPTRTSTPS